uniref:Secreted protein n=1 Tax=Macrostomum lignano TaxID=282301 RepID=A0A1I8IWF0_9PLAT
MFDHPFRSHSPSSVLGMPGCRGLQPAELLGALRLLPHRLLRENPAGQRREDSRLRSALRQRRRVQAGPVELPGLQRCRQVQHGLAEESRAEAQPMLQLQRRCQADLLWRQEGVRAAGEGGARLLRCRHQQLPSN